MNENDTTMNVETTQGQPEAETAKTYTQEEVNALLQAEADRRVTAALAKQQKKFDQQLSLSKLDGNEREKAEKDSLIAELQEQLAEYRREAAKSEIKSVLSTRGLSAEFADCLNITDDNEATQAVIDKFDKLFKQAVSQAVEKRLGGKTPKTAVNTSEMTAEDFSKLSYQEMMSLKANDPELFRKLAQ